MYQSIGSVSIPRRTLGIGISFLHGSLGFIYNRLATVLEIMEIKEKSGEVKKG